MKICLLTSIILATVLMQGCANQAINEPSEQNTEQADQVDAAFSDEDIFAELDAIAENSSKNEDAIGDEAKSENFENLSDGISASSTEESSSTGSLEYFYLTLGGESVKRIARTIYSDSSKSKLIRQNNPSLSEPATAGSQVGFLMEAARPESKLLTKQLIDSYPNELAEKIITIREGNFPKLSYTIQSGDTLQSISKKLYGSTRFWGELYLINKDKLTSYDTIYRGVELTYYDFGSKKIEMAEVYQQPESNATAGNAEYNANDVVNEDKAEVAEPDLDFTNAQYEENNKAAAPIEENSDPYVEESESSAFTESAPNNSAELSASNEQAAVADDIFEMPEKNEPIVPARNSLDKPKRALFAKNENSDGFVIAGINIDLKKIIYIVIICLVAAAALILTKPSKKKRFNVDQSLNNIDNSANQPPKAPTNPLTGITAKPEPDGEKSPKPLDRSNIKERISLRTQKGDKKQKNII